MPLFRYIPVWQREANSAKLYRCFEVIESGSYVVQSVDYYALGSSREHVRQLEEQFLELFIEQSPDERSAPQPSIEEAIRVFEAEFASRA